MGIVKLNLMSTHLETIKMVLQEQMEEYSNTLVGDEVLKQEERWIRINELIDMLEEIGHPIKGDTAYNVAREYWKETSQLVWWDEVTLMNTDVEEIIKPYYGTSLIDLPALFYNCYNIQFTYAILMNCVLDRDNFPNYDGAKETTYLSRLRTVLYGYLDDDIESARLDAFHDICGILSNIDKHRTALDADFVGGIIKNIMDYTSSWSMDDYIELRCTREQLVKMFEEGGEE